MRLQIAPSCRVRPVFPGQGRSGGPPQPSSRGVFRRARFRPAFTLLELSLSLGIVALLMGSLGSVIIIASRALPDSPAVASSGMAVAAASEQLSQDLRFATLILDAGPRHLIFNIPDRTGSGTDETVTWEWDGPGEPLLRTFNSDPAVPVVASLYDFDLQYSRRRYTESEFLYTTSESEEILLCSFIGWPNVTHSSRSVQITATYRAAQKFVVDRVDFPPDTTSWRITRVSLRLRSGSLLGSGVTVGIHRPAQLLGFIPLLTPVGTPGVVPSSVLTSSPQWHDATYNDVTFTDPDERHLIIVVQPALLTNIAYLEYYTANNAPKDEYVFQITNDAGLTWTPTTNTHRNDAPFYVYGSYTRSGLEEVIHERFTLGQVTVAMQPGQAVSGRLTSGVQLPNHPEMPAP